MAYDLIKISALPAATPDESQEIVVGVGDYAKRINYGDVKADMVGTSPTYTTDNEPYLMRQTANTGVVGKCALNKLVGGSLGWNQLVQNGNFANTSNWTAAYGGFTVSGNVATITATAQWGRIAQNVSVSSGHKYLFGADLKGTTNNYAQFGTSQYLSGTSWEHISFLYFATSTTTVQLMIGDKSTSGWQAFNAQNVQVLDLTAMFGSTIADYVYGLGSTSGIAWLRKYIDIDSYHAYDTGSIQSVQATAHVTKDANNNVIGNYSLGSDTLRGIPQLVSDKLAFDGDEKYPDGTIKRKYKIVTYNGSENWVSDATTAYAYRYYVADDTVKRYTNYINHMIANIPIIDTYNPQSAVSEPLSVTAYTYTSSPNNNWVYMVASASGDIDTVAKLKTYLSAHPVTVVLPLVTETTESSTAFQKVQTIDADGTESFTTSSPVPVGHETQTPDNILAALGWLGE